VYELIGIGYIAQMCEVIKEAFVSDILGKYCSCSLKVHENIILTATRGLIDGVTVSALETFEGTARNNRLNRAAVCAEMIASVCLVNGSRLQRVRLTDWQTALSRHQ